MKLPLIEIAVI